MNNLNPIDYDHRLNTFCRYISESDAYDENVLIVVKYYSVVYERLKYINERMRQKEERNDIEVCAILVRFTKSGKLCNDCDKVSRAIENHKLSLQQKLLG